MIGAARGIAKIADYGVSRVVDKNQTMSFAGTLAYVAPEVSRLERYGFPADVYSFGLTIYALCERDAPFKETERRNVKLALDVSQNGYRPAIRGWWNPAVSFLITSCWSQDPLLRPQMRQVASSLVSIMRGSHGLITSVKAKSAATPGQTQVPDQKDAQLDFTPGEMWRRIETSPNMIQKGKELASGA